MPHAAFISSLPAPALPALPVPGGTQGKAASSAMEFGKLFRQEAGANQDAPQQAMTDTPEVSEGTTPATSGGKPEAELAANNIEQAETEGALTEPEELAFANATLASSMPPRSLAASTDELHPAANGTNAKGAKLSKTLPEDAAIPSAPVESATKSKKTGSALAFTALSPQHKTKEDNQAASQTTLSSGGQPGSPIVPVVAPAAKLAAVLAPEPATAAPGKYQWIRPVNNPSPTVVGETPLQSAPLESHAPPAQTDEAQQSVGSRLAPAATPSGPQGAFPSSENGVLPSTWPSAEAVAPPKDLPASFSPTFRGSLVLHAAHTSDQGTGAAIAPFASPAAPVQAAASAPVLPAATTGTTPLPTAPNLGLGPALSPYDKIDQGAAPLVLHSGAQHVAVGVRDPELGWVEIETQNIAGHVDATLVTTSGQTHASLAAQLPAMTQYLEHSDIRLGTLMVHHQPPGTGDGSGYGSGDGSGKGPNHGSGYESGSGESSTQTFNQAGSGNSAQDNGVSPGLHEPINNDEAPAFRPISYISVRA